MDSEYIVKDNFETMLFIHLTDECVAISKRGYKEYPTQWFKYTRGYLFSYQPMSMKVKNYKKLILELDKLFEIMKIKFGLSDSELTKYVIIYFKHNIWEKYLEYSQLKEACFG